MENFLNSEVFEVFSAASEDVFLFATDMRINMARWSKAAIEYFEMPDEYMEAPEKIWVWKIHPEDRERFTDDISSVMSGKSDYHLCQYRAMNRYGKYVWLQCKGRMLYDERGERRYFAGIMTRLDGQNKYDTLTGLLTYNEFYNYKLDREQRAVILLGIDDFRKIINDYGYSFGDMVLAQAAAVISQMCSDTYRIYRFNGDEFIVVMPYTDVCTAEKEFYRIKDALSVLTLKDERKVRLSVTAGAIDYPFLNHCREELISHLEESLEYAKKHCRGGIVFYSDEIAKPHRRNEDIRKAMTESIADGFKGFELNFQPLVSADNGSIIGCEALLRYRTDTITDTNPGEFIPLLEESGEIVSVGYWVMEQAIKQQGEWSQKLGDIFISFNVSYQQFLEEDFVDKALEYCRKYGVTPSSMVIELTESTVVANPDALKSIFKSLQLNGFKIALDDFGKAYASMDLLKNLSADVIKIEHSFVRELSDNGHEIDFAIIESILMLCSKMGYMSVVEGVENKDVDDIIRKMNVNYIQGYYYSKPVSKKEFEKLYILKK